MRMDCLLTPALTDEQALRERTVVVIDVLRASTSIITALGNGAKEVIPVATVESAVKISGNLAAGATLLGGERNGRIIEGFHLGNSPAEYTADRVRGKSIVFSTTNGSQALVKSRYAQELIVCGFVNIGAVRDQLGDRDRDIAVVCAGRNGDFSMEDTVCCGMLVQLMLEIHGDDLPLGDAARAAQVLYRAHGKNILRMLKATEHGRYLEEIGFGGDLRLCADVDGVPVVPQLDGNVIRWKKESPGGV
jgi:2-phosphosulfolactate phosphatase